MKLKVIALLLLSLSFCVHAGPRYDDCMADYRELMRDAQDEANRSSRPRGNLASGKAAKIYNKALRKERRCQTMKNEKSKVTTKTPEQGNNRYKDCMADYQELMRDAQDEANRSSRPRGNLASGKAAKIYNKALRKERRCQAMKK